MKKKREVYLNYIYIYIKYYKTFELCINTSVKKLSYFKY